MRSTINLTYSQSIEMPSFNEEEAKRISESNKGWSLSYVYNFSEIRDVYLVLKEYKFDNLNSFTEFCLSIHLPYIRTEWNKRRILEHLNALKNFSLIDSEYKIIKDAFPGSSIGKPIIESDLVTFKEIYFTYFRFKEIFSWFIDPTPRDRYDFIMNLKEDDIVKESRMLFMFSNKSRFTDSFLYDLKDEATVYYINQEKNEDLMRFWDVFVKWGTELSILEKFNLKNLDIKTVTGQGVACAYVVNPEEIDFDLLKYVNENYQTSYIYLPYLVLEIANRHRFKIERIHQLIIEQYKIHKEYLSFERTSEIFVKKKEIKEGDKIFFPKYNDSYISHLIVRR